MNANPQQMLFSTERHPLALEGYFQIMARWDADNGNRSPDSGNPAERTFYEWKKGKGKLSDDTLRRIGYIAGIWKALQIIYSSPHLADSWVNRPNDFFAGQTPLQRMAVMLQTWQS